MKPKIALKVIIAIKKQVTEKKNHVWLEDFSSCVAIFNTIVTKAYTLFKN